VRPPSVGLFLGRPDRSVYFARALRAQGLPVVNYNTDAAADVRVPYRVDAALRRALTSDHDVYHAGLCFLPPLCLDLNRRLRGRPYVLNLTGAKWQMFADTARERPLAGLFERRLYPWLLARVVAGAGRVVCNSRFLAAEVARRYPAHAGRVTTIYNGIERERWAPDRPRPAARAGAGPVLASVTALNYRSKAAGLELVLEAFEQVWRRTPQARLLVAAKTSNAGYREGFERWLATRPCREAVRVRFNSPEVPELLAAADLFLYATANDSNDSLPRALLEAQAAGLPVVTTATSGCPEVVRHEVTGLTVPYEAGALAAAAETLLASPARLRAMGEQAAGLLTERFDWDRMAEGYARVFVEVAANRAVSAPVVSPPERV
jgi:glycosyltransferase involved in cell wall biosynthesis